MPTSAYVSPKELGISGSGQFRPLFLTSPFDMNLKDYKDDANKKFAGLHVEVLRMLPKQLLPYGVLAVLLTAGIVELARLQAGWIAYAALLLSYALVCGVFMLVTKKKKDCASKKSRKP